jgi:hypothetical protein
MGYAAIAGCDRPNPPAKYLALGDSYTSGESEEGAGGKIAASL